MDMSIQNNIAAINANRMLNITTGKKSKSTEKLSSGYRINRAADDAAGLAISEKMRRQIRGLDRAAENINDGIGYCKVADGALNEVHDMLHRMTTLAIQASNDTNNDTDREYLDSEIQQLKEECQRIFKETSFNERLIWDSPNSVEQIGVEKKRAVRDIFTNSSFDINNENYGAVPYNNIQVIANESTGVTLKWKDHNGNNHATNPISWDELAEKNYRFEMSDYYNPADTSLFDGSGKPFFKHQVAFSKTPEATVSDMVTALNGQNMYIHINTSNITQWEGTSSEATSSCYIYYSAEYASRKTASAIEFDSLDDDYIEPVLNGAGTTNLSTHPSDATVEAAKTDNTGWTFDFNMPGIGDVTAKCTNISYSSSDRSEAAKGLWWNWVSYPDGTKYMVEYSYGASSSMEGLMGTLKGSHGLFSIANGGNSRDTGYINLNFDLTSDHPYSAGGTTSNSVGTMSIRFSVTQSDTEQSILNKVNSALNDNTIVDITKTVANAESFSIGSLYTGGNTVDVPIYGGVTKIQIQAGVEAGQFIDIIYDSLSLIQLGISDTNVRTSADAQNAIEEIKGAMEIVSDQRSVFGAYQNRLEHAYDINKNTSENTQAGESRIRDTDMSKEMIEFSKHSILEQAGSSMLSQANQKSQMILSLLQ